MPDIADVPLPVISTVLVPAVNVAVLDQSTATLMIPVPALKVPAELLKLPFTERLPVSVSVPAPECVKLKKLLPVPAVRDWAPVELKVTVPLVGVNVPPDPDQLPATVMLKPALLTIPEVLSKLPFTTRLSASVVVPVPSGLKLKKLLVAPLLTVWMPVPSNVTVPLVGVNVPVSPVQLPVTLISKPALLSVPAELVRLLFTLRLSASISVPVPE